MDNREYAIHKQDENPGSFLRNFLQAYLMADAQNEAILNPAMEQIRAKYPLRKEILNEKI